MKTKTIGLALLVTMMAGTMCFANPSAGTWKLNESKSKFSGKARTTMVVWDKEGDQERCTVDGTDADGKKTHTVWTGKLDGKDYPVTGDANSNTRSFKLSGDNTLEMVSKQDGKVVGGGTVVVAADGKTRTVTTNSTNAKGEKETDSLAYDKQ